MGKILIIIALSLTSTACYEKIVSTSQFKWAVADIRAIENKLTPIIKQNNPYPESISSDRNTIRQELSDLSQQIRSITHTEREKCFPNGQKNIAPSNESGFSLNYRIRDNECVKKIAQTPLMMELAKKKHALSTIQRKQRKHDSQVNTHIKEQAKLAVEQFSNDEFELVIYSGPQKIIYNKHGMTLDITNAVIQEIEKQDSNIKLNTAVPLTPSPSGRGFG